MQDGQISEEDMNLVYVQIVWRHGDRSPALIYPNDPNANYWPQGEGMLTQLGMQQHYELGTHLKFQYGSQNFASVYYFKSVLLNFIY